MFIMHFDKHTHHIKCIPFLVACNIDSELELSNCLDLCYDGEQVY